MCGRFFMRLTEEELHGAFGCTKLAGFRVEKTHEIAPGEWIVIVRPERGERLMGVAAWGFIPARAKTPRDGPRPFNARSETLATNGYFKRAFQTQRCLIPASGYFEWPLVKGKKARCRIQRTDGGLLAFAGLWDHWERPQGQAIPPPPSTPKALTTVDLDRALVIESTTMITVPANRDLEEVHHRMPAILPEESWATWLDPEVQDVDALAQLLRPAPEGLLEVDFCA